MKPRLSRAVFVLMRERSEGSLHNYESWSDEKNYTNGARSCNCRWFLIYRCIKWRRRMLFIMSMESNTSMFSKIMESTWGYALRGFSGRFDKQTIQLIT